MQSILQEMDRYFLESLCTKEGCESLHHHGHLSEHSLWAMQYAKRLFPYFDLSDSEKRITIFASFFHDIGKSGGCEGDTLKEQMGYEVYQDGEHNTFYEFLFPDASSLKENTYVSRQDGCYYSSLPGHPIRGYRYVTGEWDYYIGKERISFREVLEEILTQQEINTVATLVGAHWEMGYYLFENLSDEAIPLKAFDKSLQRVCKDVEFFYHDSLPFSRVLQLLLLISTADILSQKPYGESLPPLIIKKMEFLRDLFRDLFRDLPYEKDEFNKYSIYRKWCSFSQPLDLFLRINNFPDVIAFDLDSTLIKPSLIFRDCQDRDYEFYEESMKALLSLQPLREYGVKVGIASRHYFPQNMHRFLQPYLHLFDFVCCLYTGDEEDGSYQKTMQVCEKKLQEEKDFFLDVGKQEITYIPRRRDQPISKIPHFELINEWYISSSHRLPRVVLFDDDDVFFVDGALQSNIKVLRAFPSRGVVELTRCLGAYAFFEERG